VLLGAVLRIVLKPTESAQFNSEKRLDLDEPNLTRLTLKGLRPSHTYRLTLSCVNRRGLGKPVSIVASTAPASSNCSCCQSIFVFRLNFLWIIVHIYIRWCRLLCRVCSADGASVYYRQRQQTSAQCHVVCVVRPTGYFRCCLSHDCLLSKTRLESYTSHQSITT